MKGHAIDRKGGGLMGGGRFDDAIDVFSSMM